MSKAKANFKVVGIQGLSHFLQREKLLQYKYYCGLKKFIVYSYNVLNNAIQKTNLKSLVITNKS